MIGRCHHVVLDCLDPQALAAFYAELVGLPVTYASDDFTGEPVDRAVGQCTLSLRPAAGAR